MERYNGYEDKEFCKYWGLDCDDYEEQEILADEYDDCNDYE